MTWGRSRLNTSGVIGRPVESANSRPRASTSPWLITSPLTMAMICSLGPGGVALAGWAAVARVGAGPAEAAPAAWAPKAWVSDKPAENRPTVRM